MTISKTNVTLRSREISRLYLMGIMRLSRGQPSLSSCQRQQANPKLFGYNLLEDDISSSANVASIVQSKIKEMDLEAFLLAYDISKLAVGSTNTKLGSENEVLQCKIEGFALAETVMKAKLESALEEVMKAKGRAQATQSQQKTAEDLSFLRPASVETSTAKALATTEAPHKGDAPVVEVPYVPTLKRQ
ncbi:hypothetical protein Adt_23555 [Abeliophyllum distichum]|uniref:Uncharacterized protein n=1 Tax=Abeliophyllum distichum TaxID=126358 RepID=A0ABD1SBG4_9LAMI